MQRQPCIHTAELPAGPRAEFIDLCARIGADATPATARTCDLACLHVRRQDLGGLQRRRHCNPSDYFARTPTILIDTDACRVYGR